MSNEQPKSPEEVLNEKHWQIDQDQKWYQKCLSLTVRRAVILFPAVWRAAAAGNVQCKEALAECKRQGLL